jgi:hypothetical protein
MKHCAMKMTLVYFVISASVLFLVSSGANAVALCDTDSEQQIFYSPNKTKAAVLKGQYCTIDLVTQTVSLKTIHDDGGGTDIFQNRDFAPEVGWRSDDTLVITLSEPSYFGKAEHAFGDIAIRYRVVLKKRIFTNDQQSAERDTKKRFNRIDI